MFVLQRAGCEITDVCNERHRDSKVQWPTNTRKQEIVGHLPNDSSRPIRPEARRRLLKSIAQGRRWLEELNDRRGLDIVALAAQYKISEKTVRSTLNLAFLAPNIIQAAINGKLPRGFGVSQMTDLFLDWPEQRRQLGIG